MTQQTFEQFILSNNIIGFFQEPITLKSGRISHFYVNWRRATVDAWLLDQLTDYIAEFISSADIPWDSLYGVPEGASKTAIITAFKLAKKSKDFALDSHVIPMGRGKTKDHGSPEDRSFIGKPKGRTIVLEDTATTGMSLIACIKALQAEGVNVTTAIGITDRMEKRGDGLSVAEAIHKECGEQVKYIAMTKATELLPAAADLLKPSKEVCDALSEEFATYGVAPLKWRNS